LFGSDVGLASPYRGGFGHFTKDLRLLTRGGLDTGFLSAREGESSSRLSL
jgi:hypothetical protein